MNLLKKIFLFFLLCGILQSCTTQNVMRLKPVARTTVWSQGREIISTEQNNIQAQVAFTHYNDREKRLYFDMEITNNSAEPVIIDPGAFYYSAFGKIADSLSDKSKGLIIQAIEPETEILRIDTEIRDAISLHEKLQVAGAVIDIALIFMDKGKKTDEQRAEDEERKENARIEGEIQHREHLEKLHEQREFWEQFALRKTTLPPGKSARGLVGVPAETRARAIQLYIPCGKSENIVTFHQEFF